MMRNAGAPLSRHRRMTRRGGAAPPAPPPPGPPTANLVAWYDASTLSLTNGAPVTAWTDLSGTNNDLTWVAGGPPVFVASDPSLGGRPSVSMGGAQSLQKDNPNGLANGSGNNITLYAVGYSVAAPTLYGFEAMFAWGRNFTPGSRFCVARTEVTGNPALGMENQSYTGGFYAWTAGTPFVFSWVCPANTPFPGTTVLINSATQPTLLPPTAGQSLGLDALQITVGKLPEYGGGLYWWQGACAEVLVYADAHGPATVAVVEAYLKTKYGIP